MTEIVKVELNGRIICTKPLKLNETLESIRNKIKDKVGNALFLDKDGNTIDKEDEGAINLEYILDSKIIKLKSSETSGFEIKVLLNEKNICSKNCPKTENLKSFRESLKNEIKENFKFLDQDGNDVDEGDEEYLKLEDILKNDIIKLKSNNSNTPNNLTEKKELNPTPEETNNMKERPVLDLSNYEEIRKQEDLVIYRYSNIERKSDHELVYQYFYDRFDLNDYNFAYVILFVGKTGDGKSTAINAFFNIIKGIKIEDKYRFILIEEKEKEKGQAESQTDGVHLYYLRDYNNEPIIIIDSQGYGDTRGIAYDEKINEAFRYVFGSVINHINTVAFIAKATNNRIDVLTKYIFSCVTSLFAGDVSENFIILATHANRDCIKEGPKFAETIKTDAVFLKLDEKIDKRWWYAFDSKCIFEDDIDKLTKFSFSELNDFYEEKVKKLPPKDIKQSSEVLNERRELSIQVNKLTETFKDLLVKQENLNKKDKAIEEDTKKITEIENILTVRKEQIAHLKPEDQERAYNELNNELNQRINQLKSQKETITRKNLATSNKKTTHCDTCKRNCHEYCDCYFQTLGRCKVYNTHIFSENVCDICGCVKSKHRQDNYHYIYEEVSQAKDNSEIENQEKERYEIEKRRIKQKAENEKKQKEGLNKVLYELESNKKRLENEKNLKSKEKEKIKEEMVQITKEIQIIIVQLQRTSDKLNSIAMNKSHIKTQDDYIDSLSEQMKGIGLKDEEQKKKLKEIKEKNRKITEALKLKQDELLKMSDSDLTEKLGKILIE